MAERRTMKKRLNTDFKVGEDLYEIKPSTEKEYHYLLEKNGRPFVLLEGFPSTAGETQKMRFETSSTSIFPNERIAFRDAIFLLENHYNSSEK